MRQDTYRYSQIDADTGICILHIQLFNKIPIGTRNSLNPRPELQIRRDDDLPVHAAHSLQDLGP